jgi:hypothetical protein
MSAMPSGIPGCPEAAFSTLSTDRNLNAFTVLFLINLRKKPQVNYIIEI